jgi:hypothetical protein
MQTRQLRLFGIYVALCAVGCSSGPSTDYSAVDLSQVSGTITRDGQPLAGARVRFFAEDGLTFSHGVTDAAGRYTLQFDSAQSGTQKGKKTVRITSGGGGDPEEGEEAPAKASDDTIPPEYNTESKLIVDVTDSSHEFNFDIKSKP